jgi:hypothetical protein
VRRYYYHAEIPRPAAYSIEFTLKFKLAASCTWAWINDMPNFSNGQLLFQAQDLPKDLADCFDDFSTSFAVKPVQSEFHDVVLWCLVRDVKPAGKASSVLNTVLGRPKAVARWFALVRLWAPWLAPRHGRAVFKIDEQAILCSFLREDGLHVVILAVSGLNNVLTLFDHDSGHVVVTSRNDSFKEESAHVIAAVGRSFESANAACMSYARKLVSGEAYRSGELLKEKEAAEDGDATTKWMENWSDGLTYCTWNALGQNLTEQKIYDALDTLENHNIKITNLIIDDNWQTLDHPGEGQWVRGWMEFEANKEGFPKGLAHTVTTIRENHPSIEHVAVWHAMLGYWAGISPEGEIAKKYKTKVVRRAAARSLISSGDMMVVDADDVQRLYQDFYGFLRGCRVDSVKTDAQFYLDMLEDAEDRSRLIKAYQDAWTINVFRFFSSRAISCMSQAPQILFHSQLPTNKPKLMVRNSDDFFPEIPSSHPWHIYTNAYNALFTSHLNILPDWDMFQTAHDYAAFHAASRCVSGGPIYITDEPGRHDVRLIDEMTALTTKGKTVILRPTTVGRTISSGIYTGYDEKRLLKIGTHHGPNRTGSGILGIFNVNPQPVFEFVLLHEFPGVQAGTKYIVRAHSTAEISKPMEIDTPLALVSLALQPRGWEILTAYPLQHVSPVTSKGPGCSVAALGLMGKMTGAAAILGADMHVEDQGEGKLRMGITLKALGVLGRLRSSAPTYQC